jgi:hypothetical protein
MLMDDWRFARLEEVKAMSAIFTCKYIFGVVKADDDLCEVKFFEFDEAKKLIRDNHRLFLNKVCDYWENKG